MTPAWLPGAVAVALVAWFLVAVPAFLWLAYEAKKGSPD